MPLTTYSPGDVLTASSLNANLVFAASSGKIAQVLSTTKTDTFSTASGSFTDITGVAVSITPSSATSKILVMVQLSASNNAGTSQMFIRLVRDSTAIDIGDAAGSRLQALAQVRAPSNNDCQITVPATILDSPATTTATTYKMQALASGGTVFVNRSGADTNDAFNVRSASTITVMEILA